LSFKQDSTTKIDSPVWDGQSDSQAPDATTQTHNDASRGV
jgi:hypothetical protein